MEKLNLREKFNINDLVTGRIRFETYNATTGKLLRKSGWHENLVTNNFAKQMLNIVGDYEGNITVDELRLGTDDSIQPQHTNDELNAPVTYNEQKPGPILAPQSDRSLNLQFFLADQNLPNGTYREAGLKADGVLLTHSLINPVQTKSDNENKKAIYDLTINLPS